MFNDYYLSLSNLVQPIITAELAALAQTLPQHLQEVSASYLQKPGKRLRPVLLLLCCEALGGNAEDALPAAAAVELFHTWTLLHDDVIDHDTLRRGQETGHIRGRRLGREKWHLPPPAATDYGQALAILAGDVLQGSVTHLFTGLKAVPAELRIALLERLSGKLNPELLAGEQQDVELSCCPLTEISEAEILEMMRLKTGALLSFCAETGAAIGARQEPQKCSAAQKLAAFAEACGLAFQLQDDILGIIGEEKHLGKNIASDLREGKRTLIILRTLAAATQPERAFLLQTLGNRQAGEEDWRQLTELIKRCGALESTAALAEKYLHIALDSLDDALPESTGRNHLRAWAGMMTKRKV
ncbi:MAG: polyprenyl synthetase family protein [Oligosphaeraceae bacterium]|nr:polyprenyl synthetase family protein [Oligosphaeraceae bacterium]